MCNRKILFVFRKPNKGNFSIERIYHNLFEQLKNIADAGFEYRKMTLNYNYDFFSFLNCFFISFFTKKYIVHITGGCNYMVMAFPFKKRVLTIHDTYHYDRFNGLKKYLYNALFYRFPIYFSHCIVTVSDKTKDDVLRLFSIPEEKVKVIENPLLIPSEKITFRERIFSEEKQLHILQIGDTPLKNYQRLVEATESLNVHYHFVHANIKRIESLLKTHAIEHRATTYSNLSNEKLYKLYQDLDVLFFASEAEGFGLPIIEAQAFGMPVITSNIEPLKSIGKGALTINPYSLGEIKEAFQILNNTTVLKNMIVKGKENVLRFNLKNVVKKYYTVYSGLL